jgi:hypothetical protein
MADLSIRARLWILPVIVALGFAALLAAGFAATRSVGAAVEAEVTLRGDRDAITDAWFGVQQVGSSLLEGWTLPSPDARKEQFDIIRANLDFIESSTARPLPTTPSAPPTGG